MRRHGWQLRAALAPDAGSGSGDSRTTSRRCCCAPSQEHGPCKARRRALQQQLGAVAWLAATCRVARPKVAPCASPRVTSRRLPQVPFGVPARMRRRQPPLPLPVRGRLRQAAAGMEPLCTGARRAPRPWRRLGHAVPRASAASGLQQGQDQTALRPTYARTRWHGRPARQARRQSQGRQSQG